MIISNVSRNSEINWVLIKHELKQVVISSEEESAARWIYKWTWTWAYVMVADRRNARVLKWGEDVPKPKSHNFMQHVNWIYDMTYSHFHSLIYFKPIFSGIGRKFLETWQGFSKSIRRFWQRFGWSLSRVKNDYEPSTPVPRLPSWINLLAVNVTERFL